MAHAGPSGVPETVIAIQSPPLPAVVAPRSPSPPGSPAAPLLAPHSPALTQTTASLAGSGISEADDELNTINIHIQINVPKSLALPCFRRSWYNECRARCGSRIRERRPHKFLGFVLGIFYISFVVCGAVAWHLRNRYTLYMLGSVAPEVIATFSPFFDLFVNVSTILVIRRHSGEDKPSARYAVLFLANFVLFVLHLVLLIIAASWQADSNYSWWYYEQFQKRKVVVGLMLYSMTTLVFFKVLLALAVITKSSLRRVFSNSVARIPLAIGEEYRYQTLTRGVDADACQIESARSSVESGRGQIRI